MGVRLRARLAPRLGLAKHVRMPTPELVADRLRHIGDLEVPLLLADSRVEDDLKEKIPELLAVLSWRPVFDGLEHLIRLLDEVLTQR